jgi:pentatricopeptide repeat protein
MVSSGHDMRACGMRFARQRVIIVRVTSILPSMQWPWSRCGHCVARVVSTAYVTFPCVQAREPTRAQAAYGAIGADGLHANNVTTCILIQGLLSAGTRKRTAELHGRALALWDAMKARAAKRKAPLDTGVRETGLHLCCRMGRMSEAAALFDQLPAPRVQAYNMLIRGYGEAGDVAAAVTVLEKMSLRDVAANKESYNALVASMCAVGDLEGARAAIDTASAEHVGVDAWAWSALLKVRARRGCLPLVRLAVLALPLPVSGARAHGQCCSRHAHSWSGRRCI